MTGVSKHRLNPISNRVKEFKQNLPRCSKCNQLLTVTCDRSKPSEFVEWLGTEWTKKKPQRMWMFPTAENQSKLCSYCLGLEKES
jgi:hypothetical protein